MAILLSDLKGYGSAVMPDDDTAQQIGGAIDTSKKVVFTDYGGSVVAVSSSGSDTAPTVTVYYRDAAGALLNEVKTLTGQTPVAFSATMERLLKAVKSGTCAGDVAVLASVAERAGTCQASGNGNIAIALDSGASASTDFYVGMIVRITAGTGNMQIREIIAYDGNTKVATVNHPWAINPDGTSQFSIAKGMFFDKAPAEVLQVRRIFYNAGANPPGGATKKYYEKIFLKNAHATLALTSASVVESSDPSGLVAFGLAATIDDTGTNGAGNNRQVAPAGITFDSTSKAVPTNQINAGSALGVWLELTLAGGAAALKTTYLPQMVGNTVA